MALKAKVGFGFLGGGWDLGGAATFGLIAGTCAAFEMSGNAQLATFGCWCGGVTARKFRPDESAFAGVVKRCEYERRTKAAIVVGGIEVHHDGRCRLGFALAGCHHLVGNGGA